MKLFRGIIFGIPFSLLLWVLIISGCTHVYRENNMVYVKGFINNVSYNDLSRLIVDDAVVVLDSDGGEVAPSVKIAELIRRHNADTRVDNQCASACVLMFGAGRHRSLSSGARIGVHRSDASEIVNSAISDFMLIYGTPNRIVQAMMTTPHYSIH